MEQRQKLQCGVSVSALEIHDILKFTDMYRNLFFSDALAFWLAFFVGMSQFISRVNRWRGSFIPISSNYVLTSERWCWYHRPIIFPASLIFWPPILSFCSFSPSQLEDVLRKAHSAAFSYGVLSWVWRQLITTDANYVTRAIKVWCFTLAIFMCSLSWRSTRVPSACWSLRRRWFTDTYVYSCCRHSFHTPRKLSTDCCPRRLWEVSCDSEM